MDYDADYQAFRHWYENEQERFNHGAMTTDEIAYAAWHAGRRHEEAQAHEDAMNEDV